MQGLESREAASNCVRCGTPPAGIVRFCPACWQELEALIGRHADKDPHVSAQETTAVAEPAS